MPARFQAHASESLRRPCRGLSRYHQRTGKSRSRLSFQLGDGINWARLNDAVPDFLSGVSTPGSIGETTPTKPAGRLEVLADDLRTRTRSFHPPGDVKLPASWNRLGNSSA